MKALIHNGIVQQITEQEFDVHPSYTWVDNVPENIEKGWHYDGTNFSDPDKETDEEKFNLILKRFRARRNGLLTESDWTQAKDVNLSNANEWTTYRQNLRDITKGLNTLADVEALTWPTKPK